jgi:acyl carrier protein
MSAATTVESDVRAIVADVLALEDQNIPLSARFFADLGGESIEVLDLSFQLEKRFGVKIELNKMLAGDAITTDDRGIVTPTALASLKSAYPFLPIENLAPDPKPESLKDLLTIDSIVQMVGWAVSAQSRFAPRPTAAPPAPRPGSG